MDPQLPWTPTIKWDSPAGQVLRKFAAAVNQSEFASNLVSLTVFGLAPLQLGLDTEFVSADVDVFSSIDFRGLIERAGLGKSQTPLYVEQNDEIVFAASASWRERAHTERDGCVQFWLPHPVDILVSKISRLEPKDLRAFRLVLQITGHPSPDELIVALQRNVDLYRPGFDEENSGDPLANTRTVWREVYAAEIDVRRQIIVPAIQRRQANYGSNVPDARSGLGAVGG